ncbi:TIGR03960 family B12-binding radical SAM protein [Clostridium sp. BJN0001]|uniref:TIGR03960 family B12-binding radical SAM protein n=1 Tax=Clostridium sp. BJN0001 TaxID=2930219 RepID=UPI001FD2327A|nr:TIGR03960 family B12-binding radical SAM protein [Clostridium sp. BJN0001]
MKNRISDDILYKVEKPGRYIGKELNEVIKDPSKVDIRFAFCFPDVYEVGMSHLGSRILYHTINMREDTYCERAFAPWPDMEEQLRKNNIPLYALETKDSLSEFDVLGFTLQYEMSYTNILNMLDMAGITIRASERREDEPLVIAGGPCAYNPEPLYDIIDLFEIGEGEEIMNDVLDLYKDFKKKNKTKKEFLREASKIKGIYVPSLYEVSYNEDKTIKEFKPKYEDVPEKVTKRIINNFTKVDFPDKIIVPYVEIVHDRIVLEVFRGCTNGCRFCQAGMIYRPVREKKIEDLLEEARKLVDSTGYEEISLSSLSTCDYSNIKNLIHDLTLEHAKDKVGVALPSIRVDAFSVDLIKEIQKVRKSGLTFAPEAGSQRMRDIINKGLTEEKILDAATSAFEAGWKTLKLYFIIGVPYETLDDCSEIGKLAEKMVFRYKSVPKKKGSNKGLRITVSTSILIPKPFTPFQWAPMAKMDVVTDKIKAVKESIKSKCIVYNYHEQKTSYMEALFARGDRKLCDVLIKAFEKGAKFDGWNQYFSYESWMEAIKECDLDSDFYVYRERKYDEILPWDFIDIGVNRSYLQRENEKAEKAELTKNCRKGCTGCGVNVNFKEGECFEGAILN